MISPDTFLVLIIICLFKCSMICLGPFLAFEVSSINFFLFLRALVLRFFFAKLLSSAYSSVSFSVFFVAVVVVVVVVVFVCLFFVFCLFCFVCLFVCFFLFLFLLVFFFFFGGGGGRGRNSVLLLSRLSISVS